MYKKIIGILICILFIGVTIPQTGFFDNVRADFGDVILSFDSPGTDPWGLEWDGTYLWNTDWVDEKIYKLDPSDGEIITSFNSPANLPKGLAWDGIYLWNACSDSNVYKLDPSDGSIITSINPLYGQEGLTWIGTYLWAADVNNKRIYKLDPSNGDIITTLTLGYRPTGLSWDGSYLWTADPDNNKIYKNNPSDGSIITSINSPGDWPVDLAWDGQYLWNADRNNGMIYKIDITENQPPIADANGPYSGNVNEMINLDGSGSTDSDGSIVSYEWDLDNDGTFDDATGPTPSYSWSTGGSHPISLKVTDDDDATDTDGSIVNVNEYPVADADGPYYGNKGETIIIDGSGSSDSDGTIVSYAWDLDNDGQYDDTTGATPSWSWSESGAYNIGLRVTDDDGASDTDTSDVFIELDEYPPIASFIYTPEQPRVGDMVSFDASGSSDLDGSIVSFSWDFGDDTTSSGMIISHLYSNPARFSVVLTVVDNDDLVDTFSVIIEVGVEGDLPVAYFTCNPDDPCINETILFNASSSFSPVSIIESYVWDFGDNTSGTGMIINHTYNLCGNYPVNLTVVDSHGFNDSIIKIICVNLSQISNIVIEKISGSLGISVRINNTGTSDAYNVDCSITIEKKLGIILSGNYTENNIVRLCVGDPITINSDRLRGIGTIIITVRAADAVKKATGFLLGPLVLRVNEI